MPCQHSYYAVSTPTTDFALVAYTQLRARRGMPAACRLCRIIFKKEGGGQDLAQEQGGRDCSTRQGLQHHVPQIAPQLRD
jgi:hypothetical protein